MGYRNDIQNIISQVDLVVLSSLWEGLPLTPIEAFSVAKPVVATSVDGTVEIVKDGINGLLVQPKSSEQLADKIIYLLNNDDKLQYLGKNALDIYNKEFSFEIFAQKYINYYERIIV